MELCAIIGHSSSGTLGGSGQKQNCAKAHCISKEYHYFDILLDVFSVVYFSSNSFCVAPNLIALFRKFLKRH